jgi:hypothetical protein
MKVKVSGWIKELKKRMLKKRRWLSLGALLLLITAVAVSAWWAGRMSPVLPAATNFSKEIEPDKGLQNPEEEIKDILEEDAYFGLDENGNLSLFDGLPENKKVIRSFFQLNIEHLESSLPRETVNQLYQGIQITDFAEYNSVLSTFSDFALDISDEVMKPNP